MKYLLRFLVLLLTFEAAAHPGVSIVVDRQGNVFYTDLEHVWKRALDGKKSIAVRNVHTHELYLDAAGNLYGENLWYEGEASNKWGHYVWCLHPDGRLEKVVPNTEGFLHDHNYSLVRDQKGTMYWMADVKNHQEIRCRPTAGAVRTLAAGHFGPAHWVISTPGGTVYFLKSDTLCSLAPNGRVRCLTGHLSSKPVENHHLMGLWLDAAGRVYVANAHDNIVQRISSDGSVRTVAKGNAVWTASGGTVTPNGDLWLLEYTATNAVRVRRVAGGGK